MSESASYRYHYGALWRRVSPLSKAQLADGEYVMDALDIAVLDPAYAKEILRELKPLRLRLFHEWMEALEEYPLWPDDDIETFGLPLVQWANQSYQDVRHICRLLQTWANKEAVIV